MGLRTTELKSARSRRTIHTPTIVVTALKSYVSTPKLRRSGGGPHLRKAGQPTLAETSRGLRLAGHLSG